MCVRTIVVKLIALLVALGISGSAARAFAGKSSEKTFRAGTAAVDVSPKSFPVLVNGGFLESRSEKLLDRLYARALVLDDGDTMIAIVVVDTCMMPRELLDTAKTLAAEKTGMPVDRILISATHTHSAPAAMGALGCAPEVAYTAALPHGIAESIASAVRNRQPARIGWASIDDADDTHNRRWIRRLDRPVVDPFGQPSARAHMHPGYRNPDAIGPSGPADPELSVVAVQNFEGQPIALLANYSMHYFGSAAVSADYFGRFAATIGPQIGVKPGEPPFLGIMSQGTSGDQHWMDYSQSQKKTTIDEYASSVARAAAAAYRKVVYHDWVPLAMAETKLRLRRRVPDPERLAWARKVVEGMGPRAPKSLPEVYAKEAIFLHDEPERELILQAIRIGTLGIAAIPDEVFAISGLKIKARSPLESTFTIELANGSEGYVPPPEQHALGGYTTWPARTAALEVEAEPKIVGAVVALLEKVAGRPAKQPVPATTPYAAAVLAARPWAFWRMEEMEGNRLDDATGNGHTGMLAPGFARFLEGPEAPGSSSGRPLNHAVHLAGGSIQSTTLALGPSKTIVLAFWNGLASDAKAVTGVLIDRAGGSSGRVGIAGLGVHAGELFVTNEAPDRALYGRTKVARGRWHHLAVARAGKRISIYLDGQAEIEGTLDGVDRDDLGLLLGRATPEAPAAFFEGKLDEVALFDRALSAPEIAELSKVFSSP
jgi:hypothetical protein